MDEIENLTYEQAFSQLEETVRKLEAGGLALEESLALFELGQALAAHCNVQLEQAELKIKQLTPEGVAPFDPEACETSTLRCRRPACYDVDEPQCAECADLALPASRITIHASRSSTCPRRNNLNTALDSSVRNSSAAPK